MKIRYISIGLRKDYIISLNYMRNRIDDLIIMG